ncbi:mCG145647, partial [Mus musculus]
HYFNCFKMFLWAFGGQKLLSTEVFPRAVVCGLDKGNLEIVKGSLG